MNNVTKADELVETANKTVRSWSCFDTAENRYDV